jgi:hemerythrin-like domain-containing protein
MKITDALKGEHGVFYAQFDLLEQTAASAPLETTQAQGALLMAGLVPHARIENEVLFPVLEEQWGELGPTQVFRVEHAEIEGGLVKLQELRELMHVHDEIEGALARLPELTDANQARRLVRDVLALAREHFAKEESMLFPMAEQMLDARALEQLGLRWAERRGVDLANC